MDFKLKSNYKPTRDQENAIKSLVKNNKKGVDKQVLLGVTGSGKTFSVANVIERLQKPALIISHNKTLAAQLYQELRDFFPKNAVSFFVSYYDYYQPEAYIPQTDTYIEKDAGINDLIDKLRLAATTNLLTRKDTIVVASVSCIYNIGSPKEYGHFVFEFSPGVKIKREQIIDRLVDLQYERAEFGFNRGSFRVRGNTIDIYPSYMDDAIRLELDADSIKHVELINTVSGETKTTDVNSFILYPAKHFVTDPEKNEEVFKIIESDLKKEVKSFKNKGMLLEARRLEQRVKYDLEMIREVGYVKGIENYSRYFDGRKPGDPPYTLLDYFNEPYGKDWLTFVDESHITFPQIKGMYAGDRSRKESLVEYAFRLRAAFDNRPLTFDEFMRRIPGFIASSATPEDWEINMAKESASKVYKQKGKDNAIVEQLLRPTGIPDPVVEIRPTKHQVKDVIKEIKKRAKKGERTLVTTLTKQTAEDLSNYLKEQGVKVHYLHSDVKTLERSDILDDLRKGNYDALVGINLLREGLDLPEVSLVAILDADKEGFLRSETTLIQTMGRAARHVQGYVILYADSKTGSIKRALNEVERRREYQLEMNKKYHIKPTPITKPIRERLIELDANAQKPWGLPIKESTFESLPHIDVDSLTPMEKKKLLQNLKKEMRISAQDLNFELAAEIRDKIQELE